MKRTSVKFNAARNLPVEVALDWAWLGKEKVPSVSLCLDGEEVASFVATDARKLADALRLVAKKAVSK